MAALLVKYSGSKLVFRSDLRVKTTERAAMRKVMKVGTLNTRTLRENEWAKKLIDEVSRSGIDIVALQECRRIGEGTFTYNDYSLFYGGSDKHQFGTGFLIKDKFLMALQNIEFVNERFSYIVLKSGFHNKIILFNVHAPTNNHPEDIKDDFYTALSEIYFTFSSYHTKIVLGDFNAKIGKEEVFRPVIGRESLHDVTNENGLKLINFATQTESIVKSTCFKHRATQKWTWSCKHHSGITRNQIDHILIDKRHQSCILDVRTHLGIYFPSDHQLVVAKLKIRLAARQNQRNPQKPKSFDVDKLQDRQTQQTYASAITRAFDSQDNEIGNRSVVNIEGQWESLKNIITNVASNVIGNKKATKQKGWFDEDCAVMWETRRREQLRNRNTHDRGTDNRLREINKRTHRLFRQKRRDYEREQVKRVEHAKNERERSKAIQNLGKNLGILKTNTLDMITNTNGDLLTEKKEIAERLKLHFQALLNVHNIHNTTEDDSLNTTVHGTRDNEIHNENPQTVEPTLDEVRAAIKNLKNNKASGIDLIPSELIKHGGSSIVRKIHTLICKIWNDEVMPEEWKNSIFIPIFKKGDKKDCKNYRGIALLSSSYKVFASILLNRITPIAENIIGDYQCGFRRNRSTTDQIFSIRQLQEKKWEYKEALYLLFIDFRCAYDSVIRDKMYQILCDLGVPRKLVSLIKMTLTDNTGRVRVQGLLSNPFDITNGLKQGDALSPIIFNLVLEYVVRKVKATGQGANHNGTHQILGYADDLGEIGDTEEIIIRNAQLLTTAAMDVGLTINEDKTVYMVMDRQDSQPQNDFLTVGNASYKRVENFRYLGSIINEDGKITPEIDARIQAGNARVGTLNKIFKSADISKNTKVTLYRTVVQPAVLYGCETLALTQADENKLRVFENKILRRIYGGKIDEETGTWRRLWNRELEQLYNSPSILQRLTTRRLNWAGHVARMDENRTPLMMLREDPNKRVSRGRPRNSFSKMIQQDLDRMGYEGRRWKEIAQNRGEWRGCATVALSTPRRVLGRSHNVIPLRETRQREH